MTRDPYEYFRVEARELLDQLGDGILRLERVPDTRLIAALLRLAHTLKGAAGVVAQPGIAADAHTLEDVLAPYRERSQPLPAEAITDLLAIVDRMSSRLATLTAPTAPGSPPSATSTVVVGLEPADATRTSWANAEELDDLLEAITQAGVRLAAARHATTAMTDLQRLTHLLNAELTPRTDLARSDTQLPPAADRVTTAGSLAAALDTGVAGLRRELAQTLHHADRDLRHAREAAERLRLVPAGSIFTSLRRAVRDVALAQHKSVDFDGRGGDVRLGPVMLRQVHHALLHIVRNAVVHGIEADATRRAAGKSVPGTVSVEFARRGRRIAFTCRDDGGGFDLDAIRQAIRARRPRPDPADLSDDGLIQALLHGGITTSELLTDVSGRGVGLDVFRALAAGMGGDVSIRTESGSGATVEFVAPYAMAALDGLTVEASGRLITIPLDSVRRSIRVHPQDIAHTATTDTIVVDGEVITFIALSRLLSGQPGRRAGDGWPAVVIDSHHGSLVIGVDRLVGANSVVLRPLPRFAAAAALVLGASLDAEGHPRLVLDPDALIDQARDAGPTTTKPAGPRPPILIVDDSLTTRMLEQSILESAGYQVDLATNGEEALRKARDVRYRLFLVDVDMPTMDGFTFVENVRADPQLRDIPAILVTSRAEPADRARGEQVGADDYLIKSEFDQTYLLERVQTLLVTR